MKLVVLTSDILDGLVVSQELMDQKRDVRAIVYERRPQTIRSFLKRVLYLIKGEIGHITFKGMGVSRPGLIVKEVDNVNSDRTRGILKSVSPDLIVVIGTRKLPQDIFGTAVIGAINMHSGILPYYRGADSEFWALYNNDINKIGVTIHFLNERLDAGDVILQEVQKVALRDDHRTLRMKNILLGAKCINKAIGLIEKGDYSRTQQDENRAVAYKSATKEDIRRYRKKICKYRGKNTRVLKEFGFGDLKSEERVAARPFITREINEISWRPRIFCLRIDADEYEPETFGLYYPLFEKYKDALTVFFNAYSFRDAENEILKCRDMGIDVQSHGYYHHTYNDYESNRHNIRRAGDFFRNLGINTRGFAAPMGKWNEPLMKALEDEGYEYSSDFSYDYMGFPAYPLLKHGWSRVLEIPVFPVAPELFWRAGCGDADRIADYYRKAIDEMLDCGIPVIIYAHTSPGLEEMPKVLESILDYALNHRKLRPSSMTGFFKLWTKERQKYFKFGRFETGRRIPAEDFLGKEIKGGAFHRFKDMVKKAVDFEKITPSEELKCDNARRVIKLLARKFF